jgi:hypothetical protein
MTAILRWFEYDGRRHRAWFRHDEAGHREIVVAGPDWQVALPHEPAASLDEIPEDRLVDLASHGRSMIREP